jgi:acyl-CoA carboxylase subunit beta
VTMTDTGRTVTDADWTACRRCRTLIYRKRFHRGLWVCPDCNWHAPLTAQQRVEQLLDPGSIERLDFTVVPGDPLGFADTKPYAERLRAAQRRTGLADAVMCARGEIAGSLVLVAAMDFRFMGGSLGAGVGEVLTQAAEMALRDRTPLLLVTASGGARMQEGALSLMQMAKTSQALGQLDQAGILTIALVTDPTYGGVAASFASLCDVILAEPGTRMGFAGPRVIQQTIGKSLPEGFQTAESLLQHGLIDDIQPRSALRPALARILAATKPPGDDPAAAPDALIRDPELLADDDAWQVVQRARELDRPTTLRYIQDVLDGFYELHGDRMSGDCPAMVGGIGRLGGMPVVVLGHEKGSTMAERVARNFGMATPAGYRKAARLMRLAAKLRTPLITLIDTPGAYPGVEAEERGQAIAIAESLRLMSALPVPAVAVVTGEGGSGGALALGVADRVLMFANAVYSVISPEGCASILWKTPAAAPAAAAALGLRARDLLAAGIVDAVIPEPAGGVACEPAAAARLLAAALAAMLRDLSRLTPGQMVTDRRARFRAFGANVSVVEGGFDGGRGDLGALRHP